MCLFITFTKEGTIMDYKKNREIIIKECNTALEKINVDDVNSLVQMILDTKRVFFIGVGRVKLGLEAFAKRLNHLGIEAHMVGDINEPAMMKGDLLIVGSGSGESLIPITIAKKAKQLGGKIIHLGSNQHSSISNFTDLMIRIPVRTKLYLPDEINSNQPMSSLFEQCILLLADIIAMMIIEKQNINLKNLWSFHANLE